MERDPLVVLAAEPAQLPFEPARDRAVELRPRAPQHPLVGGFLEQQVLEQKFTVAFHYRDRNVAHERATNQVVELAAYRAPATAT